MCKRHAFCEDPFEVLNYYPIIDNNGNFNEFAEVEALDTPATDDGKKFASTKLKIGAKLSFKGFIEICVDFALKKQNLIVVVALVSAAVVMTLVSAAVVMAL